jgi:hypothetical protein
MSVEVRGEPMRLTPKEGVPPRKKREVPHDLEKKGARGGNMVSCATANRR